MLRTMSSSAPLSFSSSREEPLKCSLLSLRPFYHNIKKNYCGTLCLTDAVFENLPVLYENYVLLSIKIRTEVFSSKLCSDLVTVLQILADIT
jgi:hypothetical protein